MRKQNGQVIRIGDHWYVRYWERRNIGGTVQRKRVTQRLGLVTTRGQRPPADIENEAERHMATVNDSVVKPEHIVTMSDFVDRVYLPWVNQHKRPSTVRGYRDIWEDHLQAVCGGFWLKNTKTYHVQGWLNQIGNGNLSRNTLKHIKSVIRRHVQTRLATGVLQWRQSGQGHMYESCCCGASRNIRLLTR